MSMVNKLALSCQQCMKLIRIIALEGIRRNQKVVVRYVKSADNLLSDSLSRIKMSTFWDNAPSTMA